MCPRAQRHALQNLARKRPQSLLQFERACTLLCTIQVEGGEAIFLQLRAANVEVPTCLSLGRAQHLRIYQLDRELSAPSKSIIKTEGCVRILHPHIPTILSTGRRVCQSARGSRHDTVRETAAVRPRSLGRAEWRRCGPAGKDARPGDIGHAGVHAGVREGVASFNLDDHVGHGDSNGDVHVRRGRVHLWRGGRRGNRKG